MFMSDRQLIINARLPGYQDLQQLEINHDGLITALAPSKAPLPSYLPATQIMDVAGDWLSLGGIDLQINGALGLAFPDLELENCPQLGKICDFLWSQGIDGFLPTIVTTEISKIQRSLGVLDRFIARQPQSQPTAKILGVHLEGPFLNYEKRGAHPAEYLLPLSVANLQQVLGDYEHLVKIVTLAPELDPSGVAIDYLVQRGITVSLGHSLATAQQAQKAFKQGASMVTHAFNAMPSLHHRQPGLLGEAIANPDVYCGAIADGHHVCGTMLKILLRASNFESGIFLVSDALAPIGLADGIYPWDSRQIEVIQGTARLPDGTLSGTTLPLLVGVKNLVEWGICDVGQAIAMATESPRQAIGLPGMSVGQPARFLRWHWNEIERILTWQRLKN